MTDMDELKTIITQFDDRDPKLVPEEEMMKAVEDLDRAFAGWTPHQIGTLYFNLGVKLTDTPEGMERLHTCLLWVQRFIQDVRAIQEQQRSAN